MIPNLHFGVIITLNCIKPVKITMNKKQCTLLIKTIKYTYIFNYVQIHKYFKIVSYSLTRRSLRVVVLLW